MTTKTPKKNIDTYSYRGWLISDSFIKRSLASVGYNFIGTLFIYLVLLVIGVVVGGIAYLIYLGLNFV